MKCIKCGHEIHEDDMCCYNCGAINPYLPENISFLKRNHINPKKLGAKGNKANISRVILTTILVILFVGIIIGLIYYIFLK